MKLKNTLFLLFTLPLFSSCTKEYITEEYVTKNVEAGTQVFTYNYEVVPNDWKLEHADDGRNYLYAEFENRDLTERVLSEAAVTGSVYYTYNISEDLKSWNNLPYVLPYKTKNDTVIGEVIRFEYEPKRITFVIEDLTGNDPEPMVNPITFKVNVVTNAK